MRKIMILTAVLFVSTFFISCTNDDGNQDTLIGKWQQEQRFTNEISDDISDCEKKSTLEFKGDNTFVDIGNSEDPDKFCDSFTTLGTWEQNGENAIKISFDGDSEILSATYTFTNGKLNLVIENVKTVWNKVN